MEVGIKITNDCGEERNKKTTPRHNNIFDNDWRGDKRLHQQIHSCLEIWDGEIKDSSLFCDFFLIFWRTKHKNLQQEKVVEKFMDSMREINK